jgi:hypothetical protein
MHKEVSQLVNIKEIILRPQKYHIKNQRISLATKVRFYFKKQEHKNVFYLAT